MTSYLKIDHVDKSFHRGSRETEVLKDVSLSIESGEYVSIIGHSGCGKSTLLNIVAGLLPVTRGAVLLENQEVNEPGPDRAVVFQNHSLLPWLTVYQNVKLAVDKVFSSTRSRESLRRRPTHQREMAHAHCRWRRRCSKRRAVPKLALRTQWHSRRPATSTKRSNCSRRRLSRSSAPSSTSPSRFSSAILRCTNADSLRAKDGPPTIRYLLRARPRCDLSKRANLSAKRPKEPPNNSHVERVDAKCG